MRNCRNPEPIPDRPGYRAYRTEGGRVIYMEDEIMENMIGRKLTRREEVRHRNGNTLDNRRENLELVTVVSTEEA